MLDTEPKGESLKEKEKAILKKVDVGPPGNYMIGLIAQKWLQDVIFEMKQANQ